MSDLFSIYEDSFNIVLKNINTGCEAYYTVSKERSEKYIEEVQSNLKEAERIMKQMELGVNDKSNQLFTAKLRNYNYELVIAKKKYHKILRDSNSKTNSNDDLMLDEMNSKKSQNEKLIDNEESAWRSHERIENGKRKLKEAEKVSFDIMLNLNRQGDQMRGIKDKNNKMNKEIDTGDSLITQMMRRQHRNKIIVYLFAGSLTVLFLCLIYYKYF